MTAGPIYCDYNATTPVDPRVAAAMTPYLTAAFGNPSSGHAWGRESRAAVEEARGHVADLLQASPEGVVFTGGGTESDNHALIGAARSHAPQGGHLVTTAVEHPAILAACRHLEQRGITVTEVGVDGAGRVAADEVVAAFRDDTFLVSVMLANNEVGTLQPVAEIAAAARERGILSHTDCAQAVGKVAVGLDDLGVDMISLAGHKLYGPKGSGALVLRDGVAIGNLLFGAGHERGRRPGTENVLQIVGLGAACRLVAADLAAEGPRLAAWRDEMAAMLTAAHPDAQVHGAAAARLPNTLSIGFPGAIAGDIMAHMPDVAVSAGAACHGDAVHVSHVLQAMGVEREAAVGTLRISLGRMTTAAEVTAAAGRIARAVTAARAGRS